MDIKSSVSICRMSFNNDSMLDRPYVSHRFKIVWVTEGSGIWNIAGHRCSVRPYDVVLLNNEEQRQIEKVTSREKLAFFIMEFEPRFLFDTGLLPLFTERVAGYAHRIIQADQALRELLERIKKEEERGDRYSGVVIASSVLSLLALSARKIGLAAEGGPRLNPLMQSVLDHIDRHYTRPLGLPELAEAAHMSSTAFSKYFTKCNGIGPAQYIIRKRIALAVRLLEETDRTVLEIALECGFRNMANFYKAFRSLTGLVPGEYRASLHSTSRP